MKLIYLKILVVLALVLGGGSSFAQINTTPIQSTALNVINVTQMAKAYFTEDLSLGNYSGVNFTDAGLIHLLEEAQKVKDELGYDVFTVEFPYISTGATTGLDDNYQLATSQISSDKYLLFCFVLSGGDSEDVAKFYTAIYDASGENQAENIFLEGFINAAVTSHFNESNVLGNAQEAEAYGLTKLLEIGNQNICNLSDDEYDFYLSSLGFGGVNLDNITFGAPLPALRYEGDPLLISDFETEVTIAYQGVTSDLYAETLAKLTEIKISLGFDDVMGYIVDYNNRCETNWETLLTEAKTKDFAIIQLVIVIGGDVEGDPTFPLYKIRTLVLESTKCTKDEDIQTFDDTNISSSNSLRITGTGNSFIEVLFPFNLIDSFFIDFYGQHILEPLIVSESLPSRTAFGYQVVGNCTFVVGAGVDAAAGNTWLIYPNGEYFLYPYEYVFREWGVAAGWDQSIDASIEAIYARNWRDNDNSTNLNPSQLAGNYEYINGGLGVDIWATLGLVLQVNLPHCWFDPLENCPSWWTFSGGVAFGVALVPGVTFSVATSLIEEDNPSNTQLPMGGTAQMLTNEIKTMDRSFMDIFIQYCRFHRLVVPKLGMGIMMKDIYDQTVNVKQQ